jgi:hypothetical protein
MGLDQTLLKKHTIWPAQQEDLKIEGINGIDTINPGRVCEIVEKVAVWRKSNQIHRWFVEKVQDGNDDCREYEVSREQLQDLLDMVNEIGADHGKAEELLPTQEGFFFGGTEYDTGYFADIRYTGEILTELLAEQGGYFYYTSSW